MRCVLRIDPAAETLEAALVLDRYRACSTLFMFVGRPRQVRVLGLSAIPGEILLLHSSAFPSRAGARRARRAKGDRHSQPAGRDLG